MIKPTYLNRSVSPMENNAFSITQQQIATHCVEHRTMAVATQTEYALLQGPFYTDISTGNEITRVLFYVNFT